MRKETSQWGKDVRKAVIDKDMTLKQLAESIGYSYAVVLSVISGKYSKPTRQSLRRSTRSWGQRACRNVLQHHPTNGARQ